MSSSTPHRTLAHSSIEAALRGAGMQDHPAVLAALVPYGYDPRCPHLEYDWAIRDVMVPAVELAGGQEVQWTVAPTGPEAYDLSVQWATEGPPGRPITL